MNLSTKYPLSLTITRLDHIRKKEMLSPVVATCFVLLYTSLAHANNNLPTATIEGGLVVGIFPVS